MRIPYNVIDDLLQVYAPAARYLRTAWDTQGGTEGEFCISQTPYLRQGISTGHLNMADMIVCYNQLAYVGIAQRLKEGNDTRFEGVSYSFFRNNVLGALIYKMDDIKFRHPINTDRFRGRIHFKRIHRRSEEYFIRTTFDFERAATGEVGLVMHTGMNR